MRTLVVETPEGVDLTFEVAGAGSRFGAGLVDSLLFALGWATLTALAYLAASFDPTGQASFVTGLVAGGAILALIGYHTLFPIFWAGQTPGKRLFGIRVARADGYPAASFQMLMRSLFWPLEAILTLSLPLPMVLMTLTERGQRLGDLVGGTTVLRDPRPEAGGEPLPDKTWSELQRRELALVPALAARIDDEEYELLRDVLARRGTEGEARVALLRSTANYFAERLGLDFGEKPGHRLAELFLYLREMRSRRL